jgi:hypothetical protein
MFPDGWPPVGLVPECDTTVLRTLGRCWTAGSVPLQLAEALVVLVILAFFLYWLWELGVLSTFLDEQEPSP